MTITLPNDIVNQTPADAAQVEQNYNVLEQYLNNEVINRDGSVAMRAPLLLVGDPTQDDQAANKGYVDAVLPVGVLITYAGLAAPAGGAWALCNGATLTTASYPDLFAVIGYRFGGVGSNFLLPNMAGRVLVGVDVGQLDIDTVGKAGGTTAPPLRTHTHSIGHDHPVVESGIANSDHQHWMGHAHSAASGTVSSDHSHSFNVNTAWDGIHDHSITVRDNPTSGSAGAIGRSNAGGVTQELSTSATNRGAHNHNVSGSTGGISANHTHAITVDAYNALTGGQSAHHTHNVDVPAYVGESAAPTQAVDAVYRPPFMTISYLIRVM